MKFFSQNATSEAVPGLHHPSHSVAFAVMQCSPTSSSWSALPDSGPLCSRAEPFPECQLRKYRAMLSSMKMTAIFPQHIFAWRGWRTPSRLWRNYKRDIFFSWLSLKDRWLPNYWQELKHSTEELASHLKKPKAAMYWYRRLFTSGGKEIKT